MVCQVPSHETVHIMTINVERGNRHPGLNRRDLLKEVENLPKVMDADRFHTPKSRPKKQYTQRCLQEEDGVVREVLSP